jgi:hypothetical protein
MYEMFLGRRLFSAKTLEDLVRSQGTATAEVSSALASTVQARLQQAILRCLDPDPSRRPASAQAVAAMLQTVLLDATVRGRRLLQVGTQTTAVPLLVIGWSFIGR